MQLIYLLSNIFIALYVSDGFSFQQAWTMQAHFQRSQRSYSIKMFHESVSSLNQIVATLPIVLAITVGDTDSQISWLPVPNLEVAGSSKLLTTTVRMEQALNSDTRSRSLRLLQALKELKFERVDKQSFAPPDSQTILKALSSNAPAVGLGALAMVVLGDSWQMKKGLEESIEEQSSEYNRKLNGTVSENEQQKRELAKLKEDFEALREDYVRKEEESARLTGELHSLQRKIDVNLVMDLEKQVQSLRSEVSSSRQSREEMVAWQTDRLKLRKKVEELEDSLNRLRNREEKALTSIKALLVSKQYVPRGLVNMLLLETLPNAVEEILQIQEKEAEIKFKEMSQAVLKSQTNNIEDVSGAAVNYEVSSVLSKQNALYSQEEGEAVGNKAKLEVSSAVDLQRHDAISTASDHLEEISAVEMEVSPVAEQYIVGRKLSLDQVVEDSKIEAEQIITSSELPSTSNQETSSLVAEDQIKRATVKQLRSRMSKLSVMKKEDLLWHISLLTGEDLSSAKRQELLTRLRDIVKNYKM